MTLAPALTAVLARLSMPLKVMFCLAAFGSLAGIVPPQSATVGTKLPRAEPARPGESVQALLAITSNSRSLVAEAAAAQTANAAIPLVANGLQSANPFALPGGLALSTADRAQQCLALAMYYEAAFEGADGRRAVAQVVLNRVRHPAFPHDVCAVVFQRASNVCQFTFACDGAMTRPRNPALWRETMAEAAAALHGKVFAGVGMATHYHADYVLPGWAYKLDKVAVIGRHAFYRWPDGWGLRGAFNAAYQGHEEMPEIPVLELTQEVVALPPDLAPLALEPAPVRSENEGGFVDASKGWVPRVARSAPVAAQVEEQAPAKGQE